uniref:Uncharacterized protein n=1 Tax=Romanomermis culicivorax TaxID=13658 RepID=A0A915JZ42_ROMCU
MPTKEQEITFLKDLEEETEKFRVANPFVELDVQKPDAITCDKAFKADYFPMALWRTSNTN